MKVDRALSIDEIYEKAQDFDLVLTAEAALADALNNRVERPRVGKLAYTPQRLVYSTFQNQECKDERELFLHAVHNLDLTWKEASYLLRNVISYWKETGSLEGFSQSADFQTERVEEIHDLAGNTTNIYREMENYHISKGRSVCVVAPYQLDALDQSIVPENASQLPIFEERKVQLPIFRVFHSSNQLIGATVDNLLRLNPEQVALVVRPESEYNPLIRSQLRDFEVDFQAAEDVQDSESLRTLIRFFRLSITRHRLTLREVRPVFRHLGADFPTRRENEYLEQIEIPEIQGIYQLLKRASTSTFGELFVIMENEGLKVAEGVRDVFEELQLWDEPITEPNLNNLEYYLDSFSVERDRTASGLILADPSSVAFVDRPVVFYLGMTVGWDSKVNDKPWRNLVWLRERNRKNFQALIQNGDSRFYMVQDMKLNREVTPSTYFNELNPEISSFTDGKEEKDYRIYSRSGPAPKNFSSQYIEKTAGNVKVISKSSLNKLVYCPRDYFFSNIVEEPDRDYFRKGNLYHDFGEFYANFPQFVEQEGLPKFVDLMVRSVKPIVDEVQLGRIRTEFRVGIRAIRDYLKERLPELIVDLDYSGYSGSDQKNFFAQEFDRRLKRTFTEMDFYNEEIGLKGKVDMVRGNNLVDYKSGRKSTAASVVKNSNIDLLKDKPKFQALSYITHHRHVHGDQKIVFTFFHFLYDPGKSLRGEFNLDDCLTTVIYYPWKFEEFLTKDEVFDYLYGSTRKKLLDALGREQFLKILSNFQFDRGDFYRKETALVHQKRLKDLCKMYLRVGRGSDYDLTKNQLSGAVKSILKTSLYRLRTRNYFRDDVDLFEKFVANTLVDLNKWRKTRFPVGDNDLDKVDHRDLILPGEGL